MNDLFVLLLGQGDGFLVHENDLQNYLKSGQNPNYPLGNHELCGYIRTSPWECCIWVFVFLAFYEQRKKLPLLGASSRQGERSVICCARGCREGTKWAARLPARFPPGSSWKTLLSENNIKIPPRIVSRVEWYLYTPPVLPNDSGRSEIVY